MSRDSNHAKGRGDLNSAAKCRNFEPLRRTPCPWVVPADRAPDHASLDREQAQMRARDLAEFAWKCSDPQAYMSDTLAVVNVVNDLLAYEAELVRVERERDEEEGRVDSLMLALEAAQARIARLEAQLAEARKALEFVQARQPWALATIERNGFVFEDIGNEPGNWQHLAFTLYSILCDLECRARAALAASAETPEAPDAA